MGKFAKLKSKLAAQLEEEEKIEREFEKKITETGYEARFKDDEDDEDLETTSEEDSDNEEEHDGQNGVILFFNQKFENSVQNFAITLSRGWGHKCRSIASSHLQNIVVLDKFEL